MTDRAKLEYAQKVRAAAREVKQHITASGSYSPTTYAAHFAQLYQVTALDVYRDFLAIK